MPLLERIKENKSSILSTIVAGDEAILGSQNLTDEKGKLLASTNGLISLTELSDKPRIVVGQNTEVYVHPFAPPPTLVIIGGAHIAIALAEFARTLDFKVVIIDPRKAFSKAARFPNVDELIREWPQSAFDHFSLNKSTAVASLSHDPKIDDPALITALNSEAFYIGALGSAKTQEKRRLRLLKAGISEEALSRLHAPIGMEIGAETPEEIALAVMAQVIAAYRG
jgi:xanthine dehydrogenase accessory factor